MHTKLTEKVDIEPLVRPAPADVLALRRMPTEAHFRRSHFGIPARPGGELAVAGLSEVSLSLADLRERSTVSVAAVLECAGHRRAELEPPAAGVQWEVGAVSEAVWTGLPLRELLLEAGVSPSARAVVFHGRDAGRHAGSDLPVRFARAVPVEKALAAETIVAWEMNGDPIPAVHGGPLRVVVPGNYAVDSVKWLDRITILDREFDGPFQRLDYRFFADDGGAGVELHRLPVHSLLLAAGRDELSGIAWGGAGGVAAVEVGVDGGPWQRALLERGPAWGRSFWTLACDLAPGPHAVAARATDGEGNVQPAAPRWNRLGYANNSVQRAVVTIA